MGIRSDVGIAITNEVYDQLSVRTKLFLQENFSEEDHIKEGEEGGRLFHASNIKWYPSYSEIARVYKELYEINEDGESYLIIKGCYEYPESIEDDAGNWWENPWDMYRSVSVSVDYCV